jgi:hypothetical protein
MRLRVIRINCQRLPVYGVGIAKTAQAHIQIGGLQEKPRPD